MKIVIEVKGKYCETTKGEVCPYIDYVYKERFDYNGEQNEGLVPQCLRFNKPLKDNLKTHHIYRCPQCLALDKETENEKV
jgi:hypothetical protein